MVSVLSLEIWSTGPQPVTQHLTIILLQELSMHPPIQSPHFQLMEALKALPLLLWWILTTPFQKHLKDKASLTMGEDNAVVEADEVVVAGVDSTMSGQTACHGISSSIPIPENCILTACPGQGMVDQALS